MLLREYLADFQVEDQVSSVNHVKIWKDSEMQRQVCEFPITNDSPGGVVPDQGYTSSHKSNGSGCVIYPGYSQHVGYHLDPFPLLAQQVGLGTLEEDLGCRQLPSPQFILQPDDLHVVQVVVSVTDLYEEKRYGHSWQVTFVGLNARWNYLRQAEGYHAVSGTGKPLVTVQSVLPGLITSRLRSSIIITYTPLITYLNSDCLGIRNIRTPLLLCHPLPWSPVILPRRQSFEGLVNVPSPRADILR